MSQKKTTLPAWKRPSGKYKAFVLAIKDHKNKNEFLKNLMNFFNKTSKK
jgi:hypothetical protein